eukprot:superscaffoldBa00005299_g20160
MSYPPPLNRQQIGIPQLPPRIPPPQYGGFAPAVPPGTPMIPVHMGVVTPTPTKCGIVLSWKRVQGASGKLQAFGFCEYKEPESTLRALRLLHELLLGDKKLLVKVDAKTKAQLDEWKAKKKSANGGASSGSKNGDDDEEEVLDEETLRRDQVVKGAIDVLIREYASELNAPSQDPDSQPRNKKRKEKKEEEDINAMEMEDDKRDLISREISKFRDTHKGRSRSRERTREDKKRDREEDEEDVYERRRLERRLRDKEAAYQERLKNWEIRERKKARDYSKEMEREDERRREMMKEAKRLKEFLEDYDDDRDDPKYYRGSALQKRLRDREKETELDERDRKREKEELEEIRQRLLAEGHPDPDAELQRVSPHK